VLLLGVIRQEEAAQAVSALEEVLLGLGYSWIVEFVEGQEKELSALYLTDREDSGTFDYFDDSRKSPMVPKRTAPDLGLMSRMRPELRRMTLLLLAIDAFCVLPYYWIRTAEDTLARVDLRTTNLSELGSGFHDGTAVGTLEGAVRALASFILENGEDPAAAELIRYWVLMGGTGPDAAQTR